MGLLAYWIINTIRYKMKPSVVAVFFFANSKSGAMWEILRTFAASKQTGTKKNGFIISI